MNPILEQVRETEKDIDYFITTLDFDTPHYHSNLEIHYAIEDGFKVVLNGEKRVLKKGDIVLINSYDIHSTKGAGTICVLIPYKFLSGIETYKAEHPLNQNFFYDTDGKIKPILEKFSDRNRHFLNKKAILCDFFAEIYNLYNQDSSLQEKSGKAYISHPLMRDIIEYVNQNYSQKITLDTIVDEFKYSKSHLSHSINKFLDCNLNTYVNIVRLKNFIERMKNEPETKIITIAYDCGFDSLQTFYRNFKQVYKCTPLDFIKQLKTTIV